MCGQAGIHRRNGEPVDKLGRLIDYLLLGIESRGRDATGLLVVLDNGKVQLDRKTIPAYSFVRKRSRMREDARTVLVHTRWATVGSRKDVRNAHPQASGSIAATHNGTIHNADELFDAFGLERNARVDSEIVPALINYAGWNQIDGALSLMKGAASVAVVNVEKPNEVVLARLDGMPLCYAVTKDVVIWASTEYAIKRAWYATYGKSLRAKVHHMAEGDIVRFVDGKKRVARIKGWEPRPKPVVKKWTGSAGSWREAEGQLVFDGSKRRSKKKRKKTKSVPPVRVIPQKRHLPPTVRSEYRGEDPDDIVDVLVANGWSRAEAEFEVFGPWDLDWDSDYDTSGMSPATRAFYALD